MLTSVLFILCAIVATLWAVLIGVVWTALRRIPRLAAEGRGVATLSVTAVLPARDEAAGLEQSVRSLLAQKEVELEVIVVDDGSTDGTGAIADALAREDPRVQVLHDPDLPPGWLGKTNAMHQGAQRASGQLILFSDADILHQPGSLKSAVAELEHHAYDLLSLIPLMTWHSLFECALAPAMLIAIPLFAQPGLEDPDSDVAVGAGAFLLIRRAVYQALGGHEQLRDAIVDDMMLSRIVKRAGHRVGVRLGTDQLRCRMFSGNREAFWGMTKNIIDSVEGKPWVPVVMMVVLLPLLLAGTAALVGGVVLGSWPLALCGLGLHLLQVASFHSVRAMYRFDALRVLLFPLGAVSMTAMVARAAWLRFVRGSVAWRGREIRLDRSE